MISKHPSFPRPWKQGRRESNKTASGFAAAPLLLASAALLTAAPAALAQTPVANDARITANSADIAENRAAIAENRIAIEELRGDIRVLMAQIDAIDEKIDDNTQFIVERLMAEMRAEIRASEVRMQRTLGMLFLAAFAIYPIYIAFLRWALPKMMPKSFGPGGGLGMALGVMLALFLGAAALFFAPAALAQSPAQNGEPESVAVILAEMRAQDAVRDAKIDNNFDLTNARFDAQDAKIDNNFDLTNARFDAQDTRFDAQDVKMDSYIAQTNTRFDSVDSRLDTIEWLIMVGLTIIMAGIAFLSLLILRRERPAQQQVPAQRRTAREAAGRAVPQAAQ